MRIAREPARPPRATSRSEGAGKPALNARHGKPVDADGSVRPGSSISAPAQIAVDERRAHGTAAPACGWPTGPADQACRGRGIGTPLRLRKRRDGDPRASNFPTAVVPAPDSPKSGAPCHAAHQILPGCGQPIGVTRSPQVRARRASQTRRRGSRPTHRPDAGIPRPHGSAQPITIGTADETGILRVGRPPALCRSCRLPARPLSVHTVAMGSAGRPRTARPRIDSTLGRCYE